MAETDGGDIVIRIRGDASDLEEAITRSQGAISGLESGADDAADVLGDMGSAARASKKICIRMLSNKSSIFSGGSGETLKDPTEGLTRRIEKADTEEPWEKEGVQAMMLQKRRAARSKEEREMSMRKAKVTIGAEPEERQPLACILLGSLPGVHEYTVAMVDTG